MSLLQGLIAFLVAVVVFMVAHYFGIGNPLAGLIAFIIFLVLLLGGNKLTL